MIHEGQCGIARPLHITYIRVSALLPDPLSGIIIYLIRQLSGNTAPTDIAKSM